jgi:hypothetical protein
MYHSDTFYFVPLSIDYFIFFFKNIYLQGLKVLDNSVENLASGAWNALGSAWRGGTDLVHKYVLLKLNL